MLILTKLRNPTFAILILSLLAFSVLGATVSDDFDKRDMAFYSIGKTIALGVVGSAVLDRALQSSGATSLPTSAR